MPALMLMVGVLCGNEGGTQRRYIYIYIKPQGRQEPLPYGIPRHIMASAPQELDNLDLLVLGGRVQVEERLHEVALDVLKSRHDWRNA